MFKSIFSDTTTSLSILQVIICILSSLVLGFLIAFIHKKTSKYSKNFLVTLIILPTLVELVIMMVNGNLGTSVAVLGAFSLIRFRSIPGNSREITSIFFAMAVGLSLGMGHVVFAFIITIIISLVLLLLYKTNYGEKIRQEKLLKVTIPENLDYTSVFDDVFDSYTKSYNLEKVKTTNMGSLFELTYKIILNDGKQEKQFIDELRCRNGNLKIMIERVTEELEL